MTLQNLKSNPALLSVSFDSLLRSTGAGPNVFPERISSPTSLYPMSSHRRGDVFPGGKCGFPFYSCGSSSVKLQGRNTSTSLNLITSSFRNVRSVTSKEAPMQTKVVNPSRHAWQGATKTVPVSIIFYKTLNREDHLLLLL
jgi:hypothetical protein